ncbi:unnamed protein product, partial [Phaeothamnion confervicola]
GADDELPPFATLADWPGGPRSLRLYTGEVVRPAREFDHLLQGQALLPGQWMPTSWAVATASEAALGPPLWTSLALSAAERAAAGDALMQEGEFFLWLDRTGELALYAGAGPLDTSRRRLRVLCPAPPPEEQEEANAAAAAAAGGKVA